MNFLGEVWKSASSPCPIHGRCFEIASNFLMCFKRKEHQYILHAFLVLDGAGGAWNHNFLNRPLDTQVGDDDSDDGGDDHDNKDNDKSDEDDRTNNMC